MRIKAGLLHLGISVCIALAVIAWVFLVLHPSPLAAAVGVSSVFWIVTAVDVVLGPVLTFIVYKEGKKSLRFDLAVIAMFQLGALGYGLWTIAAARPAWLVFNADRFDLAQAHELDRRFEADAQPEYRKTPWTGPRWVASRPPTDMSKRNQLLMESAAGGPDLPQRIDLYMPIDDERERIRAKAHELGELRLFNSAAKVGDTLAEWPHADGWLPLMARVQSMVVLVNKAEGKPLAVVDLRPWQ